MRTTISFIRSHPVLTYFVLTFVISWGGVLAVVAPGGIPGTKDETARLFPVVYLVTVAGPFVTGILLTGLFGGRAGLRELRSRLLKWRIGGRWYAVAILTTPLTVLVALLVLSLVSSEFLPGFLTMSVEASLARFGFVAALGLATAFVEELGWTGFAIPRLTLRHGVFATGLFVGLLWGAWHFLSNIWGSESARGLSLVIFMPAILFSFLPPYRVLMVWIYDRTGSLLVAIIMHASLIAFWLISMPQAIGGESMVIWYIVWAVVLWLVVASVAPFWRGEDPQQS